MPKSIGTTTDMLLSQSLSFQTSEGKARESHEACDMAENGRILWQNNIVQDNEAVQKPCTTSLHSQNHDVGKIRLGQTFHKPHRLGVPM